LLARIHDNILQRTDRERITKPMLLGKCRHVVCVGIIYVIWIKNYTACVGVLRPLGIDIERVIPRQLLCLLEYLGKGLNGYDSHRAPHSDESPRTT
jgi:hypothetical protein